MLHGGGNGMPLIPLFDNLKRSGWSSVGVPWGDFLKRFAVYATFGSSREYLLSLSEPIGKAIEFEFLPSQLSVASRRSRSQQCAGAS